MHGGGPTIHRGGGGREGRGERGGERGGGGGGRKRTKCKIISFCLGKRFLLV